MTAPFTPKAGPETGPRTESLPQGDVDLLRTHVAQRLLRSTELARLAYTARDGTPRVLPMLFHWNGIELVVATFAGAHKITALRERPAVAITIDTAGIPPEVLLLRGAAEVTDVDGVAEEYVLAQRRYYGEEQAAATLADLGPGTRMARIAVRPTWVGVLDFVNRVPGALAVAS
ncbi:pyridoxamine 5'-phosphate oxidase family protein [Prauserella cavernicola]|uniref:Pyridoxamine 5'-phosphate oxidase family protein n=1 Tax=Prauserella cavernicola TaxID=2800127 RepID=A0A934QRD5_9PSEU|nr:pyridoxamine 5'-phosphate oxidase family protein [Prauserella cavernicola]MBK1785301.1 pyridoxamine 5'-phosphate oxidase family protein [Prauserella cavernicola]